MDINSVWDKALKMLNNSTSQVVFDAMIKNIVPISYDNGIFTLQVAKNFFKDTINARYLHEMTRYVQSLTSDDVELRIVSPDDLNNLKNGLQKKNGYEKTNLRYRYTFDAFVPGKCNELAYAAARAVADTPGMADAYNPLFLYGGVGLGKTHLMHAIGNQVIELHPHLNVMYVSSATFTDEFITAVREKTGHEFKKKYRSVDVLLVDDVQFLIGKIETQEEMYHTFNTLQSGSKQIVFTSDVHPKDLTALEDRLTSRFVSGITADVTIPDYETRAAILEKKLYLEKANMPQPVKEFIIQNIVSNIRDLEGALNSIMAYARLSNIPITLELTREVLKDMLLKSEKREITLEYIRDTVASYFKLSIDDLVGRKKSQSIVLPRQIAMYLCRRILDVSTLDIGKSFDRDHTTVIHSTEKIEGQMETDEKLRIIVEELDIRIRGE